MKGHWTSHVFAEVLRDLYFAERSGSLSLTRDGETRVLHFDRGMLAFAHSSRPEGNLGARLVKAGTVQADVIQEISREIPTLTDLPQALLSHGILDKSGLDRPIRDLVRDIVEEIFGWPEGLYQFQEGWLFKDVFDTNVLFTFETILKGIGQLADFVPVREVLAAIDKPIGINPSVFLPVDKLGLTANEGFVLSRVDGRTRIRDIVALLPEAMEEATYRFLYGVLVLGMVQFEPATPGARLFSLADLVSNRRDTEQKSRQQRTLVRETYLAIRNQTPQALLGVMDKARPEEVRRAYEAARQKFDPSQYLPEVRAELREELAIIGSRLVEAYLALQETKVHALKEEIVRRAATESQKMAKLDDFTLRRELTKSENKTTSDERQARGEEYYQMARRALRESDYQNCMTYCQEALRFDPQAAYHSLLAHVQMRNPDQRWQKRAEDNYQKAIDLDPWNPDYLVSMARLYRVQGLKSRARKLLEKALELTPTHKEAQAEMAEVDRAGAPEVPA